MKGFPIFPVLLIFLFGTTAFADFAAGMKAYKSGDYATALNEWKPIAEKGDAFTQWNLGFMNASGEGIKTAVKWYNLAVEQETAYGQLKLGNMYYRGDGVGHDYKAAAKWYKLAAEQGYDFAQFNLGLMYATGEGVIQDNFQAYMWWNITASQGDKVAVRYLGIIERKMTPTQVEKAKQLARECVARDYKDC